MSTPDYQITLFYKFVHIADPQALLKSQRLLCTELGLTGRMIIAHEGVNATFEGSAEALEKYKEALHQDERFADVNFKQSPGIGTAFPKLSIKVRDEIVTLAAGEFDPQTQTAPNVTADELQAMYERNEDFVVLDLRNDYEIQSGAFENSVDPGLENFRDLPQKLEAISNLKDKKVVAVCTGGIRCEKATCLLKQEGFTNIYQLKDGIHTYIEKYPGQKFKGTLFVFDNRMVTDVVPVANKEVIGRCSFCNMACESYYCDDSVRPSKKILCCDSCYQERQETLRQPVEFKESVG